MDHLTDEQRSVVEWQGGHVLVEAVAGSGKTTVLVARNQKLLADGVSPRAILNVVYNKDAQVSFEARLKEAVRGAIPRVMTFHALAFRMLTKLAGDGIIPAFELLSDERKVRARMQAALQRASGGRKGWGTEMLDEFAGFVTVVKSGFSPASVVWKQMKYSQETASFVGAYQEFEDERRADGIVTFDDLILDVCLALQNDPENWALFTQGLEHLVVDEVQDINAVQFALMQGLTSAGAKLMAVGDSGQAIYGFRGASPRYILHEIPMAYACPRLTLSRSFRYGHRTALMASHGLMCNKQRSDTITISAPSAPSTDVIFVKRFETHAVDMLKAAFANGGDPSVAVLARRFGDLIGMEIALMQAGIPYFVLGKQTRGLQKEVAGLMAVLGWSRNSWGQYDETRRRAMTQCLWRYPTAYLQKHVLEQLDAAALGAKDGREFMSRVRGVANTLKASDFRAADRLMERISAMEAVWDMPPSVEPATLLRLYMARGKIAESIRKSATSESRGDEAVAGVNAVLSVLDGMKTANEVMELMRKLESQEAKAPDGPAVIMTSCHRAKGLEWDTVLLASVGEMSDDADLEEERRLTYVAVTRARKQLWVEARWLAEDEICINELRPPNAPKRMPRWIEEAQVLKSLGVGHVLEHGGELRVSGSVVQRYVAAVLEDRDAA